MVSKHLNLTHQLVHEIGKEILKGKYQVGEKLPSEAELSDMYQLSRTATREAVKMLTAKGLISSRPRQGIKVSDKKFWNFFDADVLDWILVGAPDLYMLRHFLQLRQAIEAQASFLAAQYASQDDLQQIEQALSRMKSAEDGHDDTHEADIEFHKSVLSATANPFFIQLKNFIETALRVNVRYTNRFNAVTQDEYQAHAELFASIKRGDAQGAFDASMKTQTSTLKLVDNAIANMNELSA